VRSIDIIVNLTLVAILLALAAVFNYADDILLLAPTIFGLQALLSTCENYLNDIDMYVNAKNHSAFGLDGDMLLTEQHLPLSPGHQLG